MLRALDQGGGESPCTLQLGRGTVLMKSSPLLEDKIESARIPTYWILPWNGVKYIRFVPAFPHVCSLPIPVPLDS